MMKIRDGFVSNSSASSFLILRKDITPRNLQEFLKENSEAIDSWDIEEEPEYIYGSTDMDNFDAIGTLRKLGVKNIAEGEYSSANSLLERLKSEVTENAEDLFQVCEEYLDYIREKHDLDYTDEFNCDYLNRIDRIIKKA